MNTKHDWPELDFGRMQPTLDSLHQWLQIVGKIRLRTMPWQNHSWHTAFYVSPQGFSTNGIPYGEEVFQIDFDFKKHQLVIQCSHREPIGFALEAMSVADFYQKDLFQIGRVAHLGGDSWQPQRDGTRYSI